MDGTPLSDVVRTASGVLQHSASFLVEPRVAVTQGVALISQHLRQEQPRQERRFRRTVRNIVSSLRFRHGAPIEEALEEEDEEAERERAEDEREEELEEEELREAVRLRLLAVQFGNLVIEALNRLFLEWPGCAIELDSRVARIRLRKGLSATPWVGAWRSFRSIGLLGHLNGMFGYGLYHLSGKVVSQVPRIVLEAASRGKPRKRYQKLARVLGKVLGLASQTVVEVALVRYLVCGAENPAYANPWTSLRTLLHAGGTLTWQGFFGIPWWLIGVKFMRDLEKETYVQRLLPAEHPLAERRGLWESFRATPLYLPRLVLVPHCKYPMPDFSWSHAFGEVLDTMRCLPFIFFGLLGFGPAVFLKEKAHRRLLMTLVEDGDRRLERKLRHAAEHTGGVRARVDVPSLRKSPPKAGMLTRMTTAAMKSAAVEGLAAKREVLLKRMQDHTSTLPDVVAASTAGNVFIRPRLEISRKDILAALKTIARYPVSALGMGKLYINYEGEQGVDAGGLFRDFMSSMSEALSKSDLFEKGPDGGLLPRRHPDPKGLWREDLFAVGRLMALAISSQQPLDICFSRCLFKVLLGEKIGAADVARVDPSFYEHRVAALMKPDGVATLEAILCDELTFVGATIGSEEEEELIKGGRQIRVTEENKSRYVSALVEHYLIGRCRVGLAALVAGFHDIIPRRVVQGCELTAIELELIIAGMPSIDVEDWKLNSCGTLISDSRYQNLCSWFWEVLEAMSVEDRAKFLSFCCGSGRLPAEGFKALSPPFTVRVIDSLPLNNLPTAHTCANELDIPPYESKQALQEKLKAILELDERGFGFA